MLSLIILMVVAYIVVLNKMVVNTILYNEGKKGLLVEETPVILRTPESTAIKTLEPSRSSTERDSKIEDLKLSMNEIKDLNEEEDEISRRENDKKRSSTNAEQLSVFDKVRHTLAQHPLHKLASSGANNLSFTDYFVHVKSQPMCSELPIFVSMANVFSELYWQM